MANEWETLQYERNDCSALQDIESSEDTHYSPALLLILLVNPRPDLNLEMLLGQTTVLVMTLML